MNRKVEEIELRFGGEWIEGGGNEQEVKKKLGSEGERTGKWRRLN